MVVIEELAIGWAVSTCINACVRKTTGKGSDEDAMRMFGVILGRAVRRVFRLRRETWVDRAVRIIRDADRGL
jgi:hypothetical protein